MPNQKYDQVVDLLAAAKLNWTSDRILGVLVTGASFTASDTLVSQLGPQEAVTVIPDRYVEPGGECWGTAAIFADVQGPADYQMAICQDDGSGDPKLLAFYETNSGDQPIHADSDGSLIIQPTSADALAVSRLWMVY